MCWDFKQARLFEAIDSVLLGLPPCDSVGSNPGKSLKAESKMINGEFGHETLKHAPLQTLPNKMVSCFIGLSTLANQKIQHMQLSCETFFVCDTTYFSRESLL